MVELWEDRRSRGQLVYCYDAGRGLVHAQTRAAGEASPSSAKNKAGFPVSMMAFAVSRALETSNRNNYQGKASAFASACMHAGAAAPRHRKGAGAGPHACSSPHATHAAAAGVQRRRGPRR
uniref:Uncharacterized protein n=1 Tax=Oryza brachyantha TaxID=4533 RepID=J3L313_ORYBR